ncbi:hypothetical protein DXC23_09755 [Eubacterium sp. OM08-24]|nr:hypothetical protein DXC23_09755 [Eubacterium sp. OM08-24]
MNVSREKIFQRTQKFACVANLPLKSSLVAYFFFVTVAILKVYAICLFKPPNDKPFGYQNLKKHKVFVTLPKPATL